MLMTSKTETSFLTAKLFNKVIHNVKFIKHFLNSTTDTELIVKIQYWFKNSSATGRIGAGILW